MYWIQKLLASAVAVLSASAAAVAQQEKVAARAAAFAATPEVLVKYVEGQAEAAKQAATQANLRVVEDYKPGMILRCVPAGGPVAMTAGQRVARVAAQASVVRVEPNHILSIPRPPVGEKAASATAKPPEIPGLPASKPDDPSFNKLWGMTSIKAPVAWDKIREAKSLIVAVIDTGVDYTHEDLAGNMWVNKLEKNGQPGVDDDNNGVIDDIHGAKFTGTVAGTGDPKDDNGHGTHCAGTIAAVGSNQKGVVGVTWKTQIMAVKFLNSEGSGTLLDAVKCIDYAVANGAKILNNSWGGGGFESSLQDSINRAEAAGVLFVAAAGNESQDNDQFPAFPSGYANKNVLSVLSVTRDDTFASAYSSFGKNSVDIGAPGGDGFPFTESGDILSSSPTNQYIPLAGTSMATPHVSGAAALVWMKLYPMPPADQAQARQVPLEVKKWLLDHARKVPDLANRCASGGILDIGALGSIQGGELPAGK